jgi:signal transduction histidine kinase
LTGAMADEPERPRIRESPFETWRSGFWDDILTRTNPATKRRYMTATIALVAVIGAVDYLTGFEFSFLVFYLLPVCIAVAAVGWRFGVATAALSVATWLVGDICAGARYAHPLAMTWNGLIALSTYLVVIWLLASLISLKREVDERVRQRTVALTEEIAERVRLEEAIIKISERERSVIGHELHDGLSQHLTGTALVAQAVGTRLAVRSEPEADEMRKVVSLIEQGIEQTRRLAKGLLLAEVEGGGLVNALRDLTAATRAQHRIDCELLTDSESWPVGDGVATHLYRIAEEAVRNAARHGRARRIDIRWLAEPGGLVLEVRDDGSGVPEAAGRGAGLGLRIMAHRAAMIGASFGIGPAPGGGTSVRCRLPSPARQP